MSVPLELNIATVYVVGLPVAGESRKTMVLVSAVLSSLAIKPALVPVKPVARFVAPRMIVAIANAAEGLLVKRVTQAVTFILLDVLDGVIVAVRAVFCGVVLAVVKLVLSNDCTMFTVPLEAAVSRPFASTVRVVFVYVPGVTAVLTRSSTGVVPPVDEISPAVPDTLVTGDVPEEAAVNRPLASTVRLV